MQPYYELAHALESQSLCFFIGTGFSMHITDSKAPNWLSLLKQCASKLDDGEKLIQQLFPDNNPIMPLEECASLLEIKMEAKGLSLHNEIAKITDELKLGKASASISTFFKKHQNLKILTTNYDMLIEREILNGSKFTSYSLGYPIHRQPKGIQIYHIHGSTKWPMKMVVTASDYYNFINKPGYFSRKIQTLLEENITVIIGYSLGDINFKAILNNLRVNKNHDINRQNLFYLSRSKVDQVIKDYYDKSYGLRVIDNTDIDSFLRMLSFNHELIKGRVHESYELIVNALDEKLELTDDYLKSSESFFELIATLSSNGILFSHPSVIAFIDKIISRKTEFTKEQGAWSQYVHLTNWLLHIGSIMDLNESPLKNTYLTSVERSFETMSKNNLLGYCWQSFKGWSGDWHNLTYDNRLMIIRHFSGRSVSDDTNEILNL